MPRLFRFLLLPAALLLAGPARAADHPVVPGYERFFTGEKADLERGGRLLLSELACTRCHSPGEKAPTGKAGPNLDDVGRRARPGWLRRYLAEPHKVKPGTTMPDLLAGEPDRDDKVEALVHLLASTGALRHERIRPRDVGAGRLLYERVGCVVCHGTRKVNGEADRVLSTSVPLGDLKAKYTVAGLAAFLQDPLHARPSGRMPKLLDAKEAKEVAAFLLQGLKVELAGGKGTTTYAYYEGGWDRLPDFSKFEPVARGIAQGFDLDVRRRDSNYAIRFDAVLPIDRAGTYTFRTTSDDGSKLYIDGKLVVDNDGTHPPQTRSGKIELSKGLHKLTLTFFQGGGGAELSAQIAAPGLGQLDLGNLVAASEKHLKKKPGPKNNNPDVIDIRAELVAKGKGLFASLGCASCHNLTIDRKPAASTRTAPALAKLEAGKGCLSAEPGKNVPRYGLSAGQKKAITAALKAPAGKQTAAARIADTLLTFNCYACHVRDKVGGPQEELNRSFQTVQPEMGDEGRLPPPLDGVGAKLQADYFRRLLDQGGHDRPYMHTRMPGFGAGNVGHLVEGFEAVDRLPVVPEVKFKVTLGKAKTQARYLVGAQALGCIKCHTFAGHKAEGVQGIDMLKLPQRLKRDWFHAYVGDPQRIRPGTRMPASYVEGKSVLPEVLDGTARTQIEAMWLYLKDGPKARLPLGIGRAFIPLVPTKSAILYRNFIQGAGTRAIAVGYPEKVHLAFDANDLRLALLWQGDFIDAARHWTDRGAGFEGPLGDNVLHLSAGVGFAVLEKADTAWPAGGARGLGQRFRGYRLTKDDRPTFLYQVGGVKVEDFAQPIVTAKDHTLRRTLTLTADRPPDNLYFRAAVGSKVEAQANGTYLVDGAYRVKVTANGSKVALHRSGGKVELRVQVAFKDGKAVVVQEFTW